MSDFKIEKGIPLSLVKSHSKYPFAEMEVGDSVFIDGATSVTIATCYKYLKPKKFSARKAEKDGVSGVRVWRVA